TTVAATLGRRVCCTGNVYDRPLSSQNNPALGNIVGRTPKAAMPAPINKADAILLGPVVDVSTNQPPNIGPPSWPLDIPAVNQPHDESRLLQFARLVTKV